MEDEIMKIAEVQAAPIYLPGRSLYARGFWSGVIGATVMVAVMLLFNWLFGLETLMERLQQISIKLLPGQFFEYGIQTFGQAAKFLQLFVITAALILAGGLLGLLYVRLFGKHSMVAADDPVQPATMYSDGRLWLNVLLYGVAIWAAFVGLIIPLIEKVLADEYAYRGVGVFGTNYRSNAAGVFGMLSGPVAYSLLTLVIFLAYALVNGFSFHHDVVATTRAWREKLAASGKTAGEAGAPSPNRRRTLRYIGGGVAVVAGGLMVARTLLDTGIGLGNAGSTQGTGRPADSGGTAAGADSTGGAVSTDGGSAAEAGPTDTPELDPSDSGDSTPVAQDSASNPAAGSAEVTDTPELDPNETPSGQPNDKLGTLARPNAVATTTPLSDVGMPSEVTSNKAFYHVSKNSTDPVVSRSGWTLSVEGLVDRPYTLSYDELKKMPTIERYINLSCISNPVGGNLIGSAKWKGVPLVDLLKKAGVKNTAKRIVFRASDDYTDSITLDTALHSYNLLAIGMNGVDLPDDHGAPARLLIPGIYGMKNVKWLTNIIVSDKADYKGFWQGQGWDNAAPTRTMSILFIPKRDSVQPNQPMLIGGIAFAGDRGIRKVEVSSDGGKTWQLATLRTPKSPYSWVLWTYTWQPKGRGQYTIMTRATDKKGNLQKDGERDAYPYGVEAYDTMKVTIS